MGEGKTKESSGWKRNEITVFYAEGNTLPERKNLQDKRGEVLKPGSAVGERDELD